MSFTLFLRVSDRYPCRKCLNVRNDGIGDALDNNDGQNVSLAKTHFSYIRTFTRPYHGHVNNNHAYSRSLFLSFLLFHSVHSYNTLRSSTITFSTNLLLLAPPPSSTLSSLLRIYHLFSYFPCHHMYGLSLDLANTKTRNFWLSGQSQSRFSDLPATLRQKVISYVTVNEV